MKSYVFTWSMEAVFLSNTQVWSDNNERGHTAQHLRRHWIQLSSSSGRSDALQWSADVDSSSFCFYRRKTLLHRVTGLTAASWSAAWRNDINKLAQNVTFWL